MHAKYDSQADDSFHRYFAWGGCVGAVQRKFNSGRVESPSFFLSFFSHTRDFRVGGLARIGNDSHDVLRASDNGFFFHSRSEYYEFAAWPKLKSD